MHILLTVNSSWNAIHFRRSLVATLLGDGHRITVLAPNGAGSSALISMGCRFVPLDMDIQGLSPLRDLSLVLRFVGHFRRERPDVILSYTIKNNIFGALAARAIGIPFLPNVTGLGTAFLSGHLLQRVAEILYRTALKHPRCVFFQNEDDLKLFLDLGLVRAEQARLLPGSGIDLWYFAPNTDGLSAAPDAPVFTLIARLILDKGIGEYVEAARIVRTRHPRARFQLLGSLDVDNRTAVTREMFDAWVSEGAIDYLGTADDVRPVIAGSDCIVLPSYREGAPRTLLEAAAMGKPLIATDVPGCRNVVVHGENGFLCDARSGGDLAQKMMDFIALSPAARAAMGRKSRELAERQFDEKIVVDAYLEAIKEISL